jgi:hypothetical protein
VLKGDLMVDMLVDLMDDSMVEKKEIMKVMMTVGQ